MKRHNIQAGFAAIEAVLIIVIIAMVAGTGYYVWHARQNANNSLNTATSTAKNSTATTARKTAAGSTPSAQKYLVVTNFGIKLPLSNSLAGDISFDITSGTKSHPGEVGKTQNAFPGQIELYSDSVHKLCGSVQDFEPLFIVNRDDSETSVATPAVEAITVNGHKYSVIPMSSPNNNGCKTQADKDTFNTTYQALLTGLKHAVAE